MGEAISLPQCLSHPFIPAVKRVKGTGDRTEKINSWKWMEKEEIMATHFEVERREERNRKDMEMSGHLLFPIPLPSLLSWLSFHRFSLMTATLFRLVSLCERREKERDRGKDERWKAWHFVFIHFLHSHAKTSNSAFPYLSIPCSPTLPPAYVRVRKKGWERNDRQEKGIDEGEGERKVSIASPIISPSCPSISLFPSPVHRW